MLALLLMAIVLGQDSTTTCDTLAGQTTCRTRQEPAGQGLDSYYRAREAASRDGGEADAISMLGAQMAQRQAERALADQQRSAETARINVRHSVSALLRINRCDLALNAALDAADVGLAAEVRQFCAAIPQTASSTPPDQ